MIDQNIQKKIIAACDFTAGQTVLEIGSGRGELTRLIAGLVHEIYAIEIDPRLCNALKESLNEYTNLRILKENILTFDLKKCLSKPEMKLKVIGNLPYYITSPIIQRLLEYRQDIQIVFITVQKEFGERIAALPGNKDYGAFSCFVQYYAFPEILFLIKKGSFYPVPKVDSCFLRLDIRKDPAVKVNDEQLFFQIIRTGFNQRRKTLKNSLKTLVPVRTLEEFFLRYQINPQIRAEDLNLQGFANLTNLCK